MYKYLVDAILTKVHPTIPLLADSNLMFLCHYPFIKQPEQQSYVQIKSK
jgi:hypothetical protein